MELAKAEVDANPQASEVMRLFSRIRLNDAEIGVHRLLSQKGYALPVAFDYVDLGPTRAMKRFPVCKISTWFQYLLDRGRLPRQLVGAPSFEKMRGILKEFWKRQRVLRPDHGVFDLADNGLVDLENLVPYFSHSDEGRSQKHMPIFILSVHGVVGRGSSYYLQANRHKRPLNENGLGLNMVGSTWATNFMFAAITKQAMSLCPEAVDRLVNLFATDASSLLQDGLVSQDRQHRIAVPALGDQRRSPSTTEVGCF